MLFPNALIAAALALQPATVAAPAPPTPPAAASRAGVEHLAISAPVEMVRRDRVHGSHRTSDWEDDGPRRLITVEAAEGEGGPGVPEEMMRAFATCLMVSCPGQRAGEIDRTPFAGRPAARIRVDMPDFLTTGTRMTIFAFAVSGEHDLHMLTIAVGGPLSTADVAFVESVLRSAIWCPAESAEPACALN
jgi:hypothetical protein